MMPLRAILAAGLLAARANAAPAPVAPDLGAATDFGQGWKPLVLEATQRLPLGLYRDEIYWAGVEKPDGTLSFDEPWLDYPARLPGIGARQILLVNDPHPLHDDHKTPSSPEAIAAFARFAAAALREFPAVTALEVGNEMNSATFAWGPGWDGPIDDRARTYARLLKSVAAEARAARPEVEILGGAAHSIPLAWFSALSEAGAPAHMDAAVIHPYGLPPEHLGAAVDLLRELPGFEDMPLAVTEFGLDDPRAAPGYLLKMVCKMALAGVTRAAWYPANPRGDAMAALLSPDGALTDTGRAFRIAARWAGQPVTPLEPDPFTHGCRFGDSGAVIWGARRAVTHLDDAIKATDPTGAPLPHDGLTLSMTAPLVLYGPVRLGETLVLDRQQVIADSFHQFAYPGQDGDPFERLALAGGQPTPLRTQPGQERGGVPWTPYLAPDFDGVARANGEWVQPSLPPAGPIAILHRYRAPRPMRADLVLRAAPSRHSADGVRLTVRLDKAALLDFVLREATTLRLPSLVLRRGAVLDVAVGPNLDGSGDTTRLQITLEQAAD